MDRAAFDHIADEVRPVADAFAAHDFRLFLVGGIVRDLLAGRQRRAPDIDLTTDATPDEIELVLRGRTDALWKQGARFGTIGCRIGDRVFEITTHRSEAYLSESRKPIVTFSRGIEDDLSRRDFTVNAMAIALPEGTLIDPFGGEHDLDAKVLRTPLSPEISFSDDPLRMLRAARFVADYQLVPERQTEDAICALRGRLAIVSRERIKDELDKLLSVADPTIGLSLLRRTELLGEFVPELAAIDDASLSLVGRVERLGARRAALFLPIVDRRSVAARARALKFSADEIDHLAAVLRAVDAVHALAHVDAPAVRRLVRSAGDAIDDAIAVAAAADVPVVPSLRALLDSLARAEDLHAIDPELDGEEVQRLLGIGEGRDVGRALSYLLELRLDEGLLGKEEAARRLRAWWNSHQQ
jgi:poly(A) polymerase